MRNIFQVGESVGRLILKPFRSFASWQTSGGLLIAFVTVIALLWANSIYGHLYKDLLKIHVSVRIHEFSLENTLHFWINEGLMTIFFFVVGLEIKREILIGELASLRKAALPIIAAVGGMLFPAMIFYVLNYGTASAKGWGIPMATDIAFTLGVLSLLGDRVPHSLKVFVTALAIIDDLGAVMVIAIFYTSQISIFWLGISGVVFLCLVTSNILGFHRPLPYVMFGLISWLAMSLSGVHATVAGILVALTIPARTKMDTDHFLDKVDSLLERFTCRPCGYSIYHEPTHQAAIAAIQLLCKKVEPPLMRIEGALNPWVVFLIVPLFALVNAGVDISASQIRGIVTSHLSLGIVLGLLIGKQIGIFVFSWVAIRIGVANAPEGVNLWDLYGGSVLCGIGFTMSLFIADLAFHHNGLLDTAKLSILIGSLLSGVFGYTVLRIRSEKLMGC